MRQDFTANNKRNKKKRKRKNRNKRKMEKQKVDPIATCPHLYSPVDNEDDPEDDDEQCPQVL